MSTEVVDDESGRLSSPRGYGTYRKAPGHMCSSADRRDLDLLEVRAWIWPQPTSHASTVVQFALILLYVGAIVARVDWLWPLALVPLMGIVLLWSLYSPSRLKGDDVSTRAMATVRAASLRRASCFIVFLTATLHAFVMPYWYRTAPLELGLACMIGGTALTSILVSALASPTTRASSERHVAGIRIVTDGTFTLGLLGNFILAGSFALSFIMRAQLQGEHLVAVVVACSSGALVGTLRPSSAFWLFRGGPADPAAWWFPAGTVDAIARGLPQLELGPRLASSGPILRSPMARESRFGRILRDALSHDRSARESLSVLSPNAPPRSLAAELRSQLRAPRDRGGQIAYALEAANDWIPVATRGELDRAVVETRLVDLTRHCASVKEHLRWSEDEARSTYRRARIQLESLRAETTGWDPTRLDTLEAPVSKTLDAIEHVAWVGDEQTGRSNSNLMETLFAFFMVVVAGLACMAISFAKAG